LKIFCKRLFPPGPWLWPSAVAVASKGGME
jgi:hypothetical protein